MRFIILNHDTHEPLNPASQLPGRVGLLLSPDVKQLSASSVNLTKLSPHEAYPTWRHCLVEAYEREASISLSRAGEAEELTVALTFSSTVESQRSVEPESQRSVEPESQRSVEPESQRSVEPELESQEDIDPEPTPERQVDHADMARVMKQILAERLEITRRLRAQLMKLRAVEPPRSWSPQEQIQSILCDSNTTLAIEESARWSLEVGAQVRAQLIRWAELDERHKAGVRRMITLLEDQGLQLNQLPEWLLSAEGCEAQADNYRKFLSVYEEVSPLRSEDISSELHA